MTQKFDLWSVGDLLAAGFTETYLKEQFREFSCRGEHDVENYLRERAIDDDINHVSRTYVYVSLDDLQRGKINVAGMFTLAMTSLESAHENNAGDAAGLVVDDEGVNAVQEDSVSCCSTHNIEDAGECSAAAQNDVAIDSGDDVDAKKMDRAEHHDDSDSPTLTPAYLLVQIARSDAIARETLPGKRIHYDIEEAVHCSNEKVGGAILVLDCRSDQTGLIKSYKEDKGFVYDNSIQCEEGDVRLAKHLYNPPQSALYYRRDK